MVFEKTLESPLDCKEIQPVHSEGDQSWVFIGGIDAEAETPILLATWCEELTHWKRLWCWEGFWAGGEGDDRGWDGWITSLTQWMWVWVNSGRWLMTGRPGVLRFMGSQSRTWLSDWTELKLFIRHQFTQFYSPNHYKNGKGRITKFMGSGFNLICVLLLNLPFSSCMTEGNLTCLSISS